nr:MAG TPA: hypothetical protein [Bacteriophage sp.]
MIYFDEDWGFYKITINFINARIKRYELHIKNLKKINDAEFPLTKNQRAKSIERYEKKISILKYVRSDLE